MNIPSIMKNCMKRKEDFGLLLLFIIIIIIIIIIIFERMK